MTEFQNNLKYDLEERTAKFGEDIIEFCKSIKQDAVARPIISQRIANYMEVNGFRQKFEKNFRQARILPKVYEI
jgi:hypothetical protein